MGCIKTYRCLECGEFDVIHEDKKTVQTHCGWCENKVKLIGVIYDKRDPAAGKDKHENR